MVYVCRKESGSMRSYLEGGDDEVAHFHVALPDGDGDELLQFQEGGFGGEDGGDGRDAHFGAFGHVQHDGHNSSQEFTAVVHSQRLQGVDDVGTQSVRHDAALGVGDEALDGRRDLGVVEGHQSDHLLRVGFGVFEGVESDAAVFVESISLARAVWVGACDSHQVTVRHGDGSLQFPTKQSLRLLFIIIIIIIMNKELNFTAKCNDFNIVLASNSSSIK